jgi:cyclic pyranopterin phosphate synthase
MHMTTVAPSRLPLLDSFGRVATDLRVSLTDRCNLRCTYCMPAQGLPWLPREELLTDDEIVRLVVIAVAQLGIREVRFTGGEPLLRPGLVDIVRATAATGATVSMTTNAIGLASRAADLAAAGLARVNVSLDTLRPETFRQIARRSRLDDTLAGLAAAASAGMGPIKVNTVLLRDTNDDEAGDLLAFCLHHGYELRFIEQMPLDPMHAWSRDRFVTAAEILDQLAARWTLTPDPTSRGGAPAETWLVDGGPARVGVVASVTRPFCADCDRTRLTADGQVRTCLFAREESDLRAALRHGATDRELALRWQAAMAGKRAGHGIDDPKFAQPQRPMSAIGG